MINILSFKNNNLENEKQIDERIEYFGRTLNNAFQQFQRLWDDYKELLQKCKDYKSNSLNVLHKVQNVAENIDTKCCKCTVSSKQNTISEKKSVSTTEVGQVDHSLINLTTNIQAGPPNPQDCEIFQIFSQDFCTQGLEKSFVDQNTNLPQEFQSVTPKCSRSPILGLKKRKPRVASLQVSSSAPSQKSIVVLNDFTNEQVFGNEHHSISNPLLESNDVTASIDTLSNPVQLSSPASEKEVTSMPKSIRRWGLNTIHNINTEIRIGTNKKLKQSKLFLTAEKVTDLSNCEDVCTTKSNDHDQATGPQDVIGNSCSRANNNCLDDSVIQVSPKQKKELSKMRRKLAQKNKSTEILQQKLNMDGKIVKEMTVLETQQCTKNDIWLPDTDITIFDPKIASTQYIRSPSFSKDLKIKRSLVQDKPGLVERIHLEMENGNDSNVIDETMYMENVIPSDSRLQKKLYCEKNVKKKRLSLNKGVLCNEHVSKSKRNTVINVSTSNDLKIGSPPTKKIALSNFNGPLKKKDTSPTYAYKGSPVRKRAKRAQLNGWSCLKCQKYYEAIELDEEELQKRKNICSRHRSKFNEFKKVSQQDYWEPEFPSSFHSTMWLDD